MKLPSYGFLIPASLLLGLAPFVPEPHLAEKIRWLFTGHAFKPIDVFDLFLHGSFPALLLVKAGRDAVGRMRGSGGVAVDGSATSGPAGKGGSRAVEDGEDPGTPDTRAQRRRKERERKRN